MPSITFKIIPDGEEINLRDTLEGLKKQLLEAAIKESSGSYESIGRQLGLKYPSDVRYRLHRYGLTGSGRRPGRPRKQPTEILLKVKSNTRHVHKVKLSPRFENDPRPWVCVIEGCGKRMKGNP